MNEDSQEQRRENRKRLLWVALIVLVTLLIGAVDLIYTRQSFDRKTYAEAMREFEQKNRSSNSATHAEQTRPQNSGE